MTTAGNRWGIVMSRDATYSNQVFCLLHFAFIDKEMPSVLYYV